MTEEIFNERQGMLFIQPAGPGTSVIPIICADVGDVTMPLGSVTNYYKRTGIGTFAVRHRTKGSPGAITFDIVTDLAAVASELDKIVANQSLCPADFFFHHEFCDGRADNPLNYKHGQSILNGDLTSLGQSNTIRGRYGEDDSPTPVSRTFSVNAPANPVFYYKLVGTISNPVAEDEPLRSIAPIGLGSCYHSGCNAAAAQCAALVIAGDAAAAGSADGYVSANSAASWAAWAAQPFGADEHICSVDSIELVRGTERIFAMRGVTDAANPAEIGYSDDDGATWTLVDVGATNAEFGMHSRSLFALDPWNIWAVTDLGNVFKSTDKGLTWTDQNAPAPGAAEGLWAVHFVDKNFGWAVGGDRAAPTGFLLQTVDGGAHWSLAASEPEVELATSVMVMDHSTVYVTMDDGTFWRTRNWGTSWEQVTFNDVNLPVNLSSCDYFDALHLCVAGYCLIGAAEHALVLRSFDGGTDWEEYRYPVTFDGAIAYFGLNDVLMCNQNLIHAVGEAVDSVSLVWTLQPQGF